jgi:hypothetical protein
MRLREFATIVSYPGWIENTESKHSIQGQILIQNPYLYVIQATRK